MTACTGMKRGWNRPLRSLLRLLMVLVLASMLLADLPAHAHLPAGPVVEHLRLRVPRETRAVWLDLEREIWQPWLCRQKGFMGRDLYWDGQQEEAVLLIRWASREDWKGIADQEVDRIQERFVARARQSLGRNSLSSGPDAGDQHGERNGNPAENPFPLLFAGELEPLDAPCLPTN